MKKIILAALICFTPMAAYAGHGGGHMGGGFHGGGILNPSWRSPPGHFESHGGGEHGWGGHGWGHGPGWERHWDNGRWYEPGEGNCWRWTGVLGFLFGGGGWDWIC